MTQLILVRHGRTRWNREGRWQGQADPPLDAVGRAQAHHTASELLAGGLDTLYCSDLRRTVETAQIIGDELGIAVSADARLREIDLGRWQGMLASDIQAQYPDEFQRWHTAPLTARPPDGEDVQTLAARVLQAIVEITQRHPNRRIGVVSHELPIAVIVAQARNENLAQIRSLLPATGAWQEVTWEGPGSEQPESSLPGAAPV